MKKGSNGDSQATMALVIRKQAEFVSDMRVTRERVAKLDRELEQIKAILIRHERILNDLPEAICQKVGFKSP